MSDDPRVDGVQALAGCGPAMAARLARLGIATVGDLLAHTPSKYRRIPPVGTVASFGRVHPNARLEVAVERARIVPTRRGPTLVEARGVDRDGAPVRLSIFGRPWSARSLPGTTVVATGAFREGVPAQLEVRDISPAPATAPEGGIEPVYPLTEGVGASALTKLVRLAQAHCAGMADPLPAPVRARLELVSLTEAWALVHEPQTADDPPRGRRRLVFDELCVEQLALGALRRATAQAPAPACGDLARADALRAGLPFALSAGQERVVARIARLLAQPAPARVLVQGEVGAGKTVVAALAAAQSIGSGRSAALLVPTEVLARQHARTLTALGAPAGIAPVLVLAGQPAPPTDGPALFVGTQALLGDPSVRASSLGLVICDEQHRFGVRDREALLAGAVGVHYVQCTATPIPRSLALTAWGDLDVLRLPSRPDAARRVTTHIVRDGSWHTAVMDACAHGDAVFIICPQIEGEGWSVTSPTLAELLSDVRLRRAHSRQPAAERDAALGDLAEGRADVLLATTVIEVGIDVPRAGLCVVLGAERFGLATLHQLRGRVGRAGQEARCLCVPSADAPPEAILRLEAFAATDDGMALAERDLAIRGAGERVGATQSGTSARLASLKRDRRTLAEARYAARAILRVDPGLRRPAHAALRVAAIGYLRERGVKTAESHTRGEVAR